MAEEYVPFDGSEVSPSPRRAWIEIIEEMTEFAQQRSPSPRRAWIEIVVNKCIDPQRKVALPSEGVD